MKAPKIGLVGALVLLGIPIFAQAPVSQKEILKQVSFDQNLNAQIPLNLVFKDESGKVVKLGDFFDKKPVILSLVYFECPMLCTESLNGLLRAVRSISFDVGKEFRIVTVSFDSRETPVLAAAKKTAYVERYGRKDAAAGWAFLTGQESDIRALTKAVGFNYVFDERIQQFAHPTGILVLTPEGRISRYLYGVEYSARDLRLSLLQAAEGKIGSPVDRLILYCYHYDPQTGKYNLLVMRVLQVAGLITVLALVLFLTFLNRSKNS